MSRQIKALLNIEKKLIPVVKAAIAEQLRTISTRLNDGVDVSGDRFAPFEPTTKSRKKYKDGRTPLVGFADAVVDLPVKTEIDLNSVRASAQLDGELGKPATYQNITRHFMGYSSLDAKLRAKSVFKSIGEIARRANK